MRQPTLNELRRSIDRNTAIGVTNPQHIRTLTREEVDKITGELKTRSYSRKTPQKFLSANINAICRQCGALYQKVSKSPCKSCRAPVSQMFVIPKEHKPWEVFSKLGGGLFDCYVCKLRFNGLKLFGCACMAEFRSNPNAIVKQGHLDYYTCRVCCKTDARKAENMPSEIRDGLDINYGDLERLYAQIRGGPLVQHPDGIRFAPGMPLRRER